MKPVSWVSDVFGFRGGSSRRRLEAELSAFKTRVSGVDETRSGEWTGRALSNVLATEEALHRSEMDKAWISFDQARREEIEGLDEEELRARRIALLKEADKLTDWRRESVKTLLDLKDGNAITKVMLREATRLRDEDLENLYFKNGNLIRHLQVVSFVTCVVLATICALAFWGILFTEPGELAFVILFGALGATVSTMMSLVPDVSGRIPSQLLTGVLAYARPLLGAAAAVGIYALMQSGFITVGTMGKFKYLAVAFAAGFSDKFLLSAISKVAQADARAAGRDKQP